MNPETVHAITISVKALNGPLMVCLLFGIGLIAAGIWNLVLCVMRLEGAINEIGKIYDEQVNGPVDDPNPPDLAS